MAQRRFGVGIVGFEPGRSWAAVAHLPALRALAQDYSIVGVANRSAASAARAVEEIGEGVAYPDVEALVRAPDVDVVIVTVKVPHHRALVTAAAEAGKHIFCEWPLGVSLEETIALADLVRERGVKGVIGTQARVSPAIVQLRRLVAEGYVGEVLSSTLTAHSGGFGARIPSRETYGYLMDEANGASMLRIPLGHTLAALRDVLGEVAELSAVTAMRIPHAVALDTGETFPARAPDQVVVGGVFESGAVLAIHYRDGPRHPDDGLVWEINGTEGDLRLTAPSGLTQMMSLALSGGRGEHRRLAPIPVLDDDPDLPGEAIPGNVARIYRAMAADLRSGTNTAPSFDDAIATHRLIDAIERAAASGARVQP